MDRDLTEILIEKIDGNIRAHIEENASMIEIYNKYARLRLLDDVRTIDFNHRNTKNQKQNYVNNNQNFNKNRVTYVEVHT